MKKSHRGGFAYKKQLQGTISPCYNSTNTRKAGWHAGGSKKRNQKGGSSCKYNNADGASTLKKTYYNNWTTPHSRGESPGKNLSTSFALAERHFSRLTPLSKDNNVTLITPLTGCSGMCSMTPTQAGGAKERVVKKTSYQEKGC